MVLKEEYAALIKRLEAPENSKLKEELPLKPDGYDLTFHIKRINDYVNSTHESNPITVKLLELDYMVSLRKAKEIMDAQGWK